MTVGDESPCATSSRLSEPGLSDRLGVPGADNVRAARNRSEQICGKIESGCCKLGGGSTTKGENFSISNIIEDLVGRMFYSADVIIVPFGSEMMRACVKIPSIRRIRDDHLEWLNL